MAKLKHVKNDEVRAPSVAVDFQGGFLTGRRLNIPQPLPEVYYAYREQPLVLQIRPDAYVVPMAFIYYLKFNENGVPYYQLDYKQANELAKRTQHSRMRIPKKAK